MLPFLFIYMSVCLSVCLPLVCEYPRRLGEIPWSWSHGGCEPSDVGAGNQASFQEQQVLLTAEPSLRSHKCSS